MAATAARMAMAVKQVVAIARVEQEPVSFASAVSLGSEVGLEVNSVR